jgi:diguanylate cyclase (GGDEF)-like protein/putative nucleotidyltransferase with HDIG domain
MIAVSFVDIFMPRIFEPDDLTIPGKTVQDLPYFDISIQTSRSMRDVLKLFDTHLQIPGLLIMKNDELLGMVVRKDFYEKLGRPFGVELFLKNNVEQFFTLLGRETLVLDRSTSIFDAVKLALMRDEASMFDPLVLSHPDGYRIISMHSLLLAQQETMQSLYAEVQQLSYQDPLTQVNNRRGFFEMVNTKLEAVRRFRTQIAVLMIDIDNFKAVNDRYGHFVGDEMIKSVAAIISEKITEKDVIGRFGGEEYVVFLEDVSSKMALQVAESIRQEIAGYYHTVSGFKIRVTVSIGISHSRGAKRTFDRLVTEADQAVYVAKNKGRNKVTAWHPNYGQFPKNHMNFRKEVSSVKETVAGITSQTLQGLLRMLYLRDYETEAHTIRVSKKAIELAKAVGLDPEQIEKIEIGALLHDIGKIAIPDEILFKSDLLTDSERKIMQQHPQYAYDLLAPIPFFNDVLDIPYCHHEQWNGKGYPRGLQEDEIPLAARIFSIIDVWDALSSDRPYRPALKREEIKQFIAEKSGIMFDPSLVPIFIQLLEKDQDNNLNDLPGND